MEAMSDNDLPRDVEFYKLLLPWHSNPLNAETILECHQKMVDAGFKQPATLCNKLIFRLKHAGEVEKAHIMLQTMQLSGNRPVSPELYDNFTPEIVGKGQSREFERRGGDIG